MMKGSTTMKQLKIEGMTCGHCAKAVTQALAETPGVEKVQVSLEKGLALLEGDADDFTLIAAVEEAGYRGTLLVSE